MKFENEIEQKPFWVYINMMKLNIAAFQFWFIDIDSVTIDVPSKILSKGFSMNLTCKCNGNPKTTYKWYKDDVIIGTSSVLQITQASHKDDGEYICYGMNVIGKKFAKARLKYECT